MNRNPLSSSPPLNSKTQLREVSAEMTVSAQRVMCVGFTDNRANQLNPSHDAYHQSRGASVIAASDRAAQGCHRFVDLNFSTAETGRFNLRKVETV